MGVANRFPKRFALDQTISFAQLALLSGGIVAIVEQLFRELAEQGKQNYSMMEFPLALSSFANVHQVRMRLTTVVSMVPIWGAVTSALPGCYSKRSHHPKSTMDDET